MQRLPGPPQNFEWCQRRLSRRHDRWRWRRRFAGKRFHADRFLRGLVSLRSSGCFGDGCFCLDGSCCRGGRRLFLGTGRQRRKRQCHCHGRYEKPPSDGDALQEHRCWQGSTQKVSDYIHIDDGKFPWDLAGNRAHDPPGPDRGETSPMYEVDQSEPRSRRQEGQRQRNGSQEREHS